MGSPKSESEHQEALNGRFLAYLSVSALSSLGATAVYLATAVLVATAAGDDPAEKARITSLVFSLNLVLRSLAIPYATRLARKIGTVRTLYLAKIATTAATLITGVLLAVDDSGDSVIPVLFVYGGVVGALSGLKKPLNPPLLQHYSGLPLQEATSRNRMFYGASAAIGALVGGVAIDEIGGEPLYFIGAALSVPVIVFLTVKPPENAVERPAAATRPWHNLVVCLRASPMLRSAVGLGLTSAIMLGPLISMLVPILNQMGHNEAKKAGYVLTVIAVGQVLTPLVVRKLERGRVSLVSATRAVQITCVAFLLISGVVFITAADRIYLLAGCAFIFGAVFFSAASFLYVSATHGATDEEEVQYLAAYMLVTGLGAPIGTLLWGHALGSISVEIFFLVVSIGAAIVVTTLLRRSLRKQEQSKLAEANSEQVQVEKSADAT